MVVIKSSVFVNSYVIVKTRVVGYVAHGRMMLLQGHSPSDSIDSRLRAT